MLKIYIACLLLASLLREKMEIRGLTSAFNGCSDIIINTVQINNLPSSNFSSLLTTSALATAQSDSSYQAIATFQHLTLSQTDQQISVGILISGKSSSSIDINITGSKGGAYITILKVIYLIVPSQYSSKILAFTVEICLTPFCQNTQDHPSGTALTITQEFPSLLSPGANKIVAFFSSISMMKVSGPAFGSSLDANTINSTHYSIILQNPSSSVKIGYFLISIIAYHSPTALQSISITIDSVSILKPFLTTTNPATTFHGLYLFETNSGKIDFTVSTSGNNITNVGSGMYRLKQNTVTFGPCCAPTPYIVNSLSICADACPPRTYVRIISVSCLPCASDCYTCINSATCTSCNLTIDNRKLNTTTGRCDLLVSCVYPNCCGATSISDPILLVCVASCSARTFVNNITMSCLPCAYDCYTCDNNATCLTCNATTDYRQFNSTTGRCDPMNDYYDTGVTVAASCSYPNCCGSHPYIDTNQSACVASCPARTYLQNNTINCLPCTYDCLSCNDNSTCLTCDNSTDKRQLNATTNRCDPIHNYRETGVTVAVLCTYPNCCGDAPIIFTAQSTCVDSCPARTYLENSTMDCLPCAYDCQNCTNNATCTSCDNSTDHRQFNATTNRCDPIYNYYDSGATIAVLCSYPNCCGDAPIIFTAQSVCASSCPVRTYLHNSTMDCLPCVYDCYNCTNHVNCTSCDNATDHRQFNPATQRCVPIYNYYDPGSTVALPCSYPNCCGDFPIIYTALSLCTDSCPARTYLQVSIMDCFQCAYDCYTCSIPFKCQTCNSGTDYRQFNSTTGRCDPIINYFESGTTIAAKCIYPNCCGTSPIKFPQNSSCLSSCPKNYSLNTTIKTCSHCESGFWSVSNLCSNIFGCKGAKLMNQTVICLLCDSSAHYTLNNNTCVCSQGYIFSAEGCKEVCGDGYHFSQKCDDGNLVNGDGCSSSCNVETLFRCSSTSSTQPSKCLFVGNSIQFSLNWVNKTAGKNQGVFSFRVTARYVRLNLTKVFLNYNFTSLPTPTSIRITTTENQLLLYADYDQNLEGNIAQLSLQINSNYIANVKNLSTTFRMSSVGSKLVVLYNYPTITLLSQIIKILSYVVIVVFLGSSLAYKMIGVQILHSFLVVYFICLATTNQTEPYLIFTFLNLININFEKYSSNFYTSNIASFYRIQDQFLSKLTLSLSLFLPLLTFAVLKIAIFLSKAEKGGNSNKTSNSVRMMQCLPIWLHEVLFFPLSIGYLHYSLFPAFFAKTNSSNSQYFYSNIFLILGLKVFLMVFCSTVFFTVFKTYFTSKIENSEVALKKGVRYANVYLFFWLQVTLIFSINCLFKFVWLEECVFMVYMRFIFIWPCYSPYKRAIHNFGQFLNLFMVIIFLGWSIARKYYSMILDEEIQIQIIYGVLLLMFISVLLTAIRTLIQLKHVWSRKCKENEQIKNKKTKNQVKHDGQDKFEGILQTENKYRLQNMLINKKEVKFDCRTLQTDQIDACVQISKNIKSRYAKKANHPK